MHFIIIRNDNITTCTTYPSLQLQSFAGLHPGAAFMKLFTTLSPLVLLNLDQSIKLPKELTDPATNVSSNLDIQSIFKHPGADL